MPNAVIVSAVRTPIATSRKGSLAQTTGEELATHILRESIEAAGVSPDQVDDVLIGEVLYGGGVLGRYAAVALGMTTVPGAAMNRHCATSLSTVAAGAGSIAAGMDRIVVAGGAQSGSTSPMLTWPVPGTESETRQGMNPTFPYREDATDDVSLSVGWNVAQEVGISREEMDAWAKRSHDRAIAAIDGGKFDDEIVPIDITGPDGTPMTFAVDEHPRRGSTLEKLASLKPLHPEIEGFSITAGNASGVNDAAAALVLAHPDTVAELGLSGLGTVKAWASVGVDPRVTGLGAIEAARKLLDRSGLSVSDIDLWEVNEAFASVPVAACKLLGLDEEKVNIYGSGCSLGHPVAASGARMLATLTHELKRRGGGLGVATMCAGGGMGGAVLVQV